MKRSIDCAVLNCFSPVRLFVTLWTVACQVPLSMGFPRQKHWRGCPFPSPGDLPNPGMKPASLRSPARAGGLTPQGKPHNTGYQYIQHKKRVTPVEV